VLCSGACSATFNQSLLNWFSKFKVTKRWLGIVQVPNGFVNLPTNTELVNSPVTYGLYQGRCVNSICICNAVSVYVKKNNITDPQDLLSLLKCRSPYNIQMHYNQVITNVFNT